MSTPQPHHIIAIGASAGGLDEITAFFDHTPLDGVSYIIVQHLSPDFKSRMSELIARHSKLAVKEAQNEMVVESNQVYLIPNNKFMTIHDNKLFLTDKENVKGPHLTVNAFFNSLAADYGKKAIAVVLSGLGADGTEGIKAIKKAGGMVIARNPETAEFGSMPANAIATGLVDFILEPALMPATIDDYVKQDGLLLVDDTNDEKNLVAIISLINEKLPLDFSEYKQPTILRRIKRRAAYNNFSSLEKYLEFLKNSPDEIKILAQDFLISVTTFFRDTKAFDCIQTEILPVILKSLAKDEELKIWVAGCATGEEAYSLAILVRELLTDDLKDVVVKIFATDIDAVALVHAGKGLYPAVIAKDITPQRLERYFIPEGEGYRVKPEIRSMLIFAQHNIVKNPPYCNMHFISCRNLLIYMTPVLQKKIFLMLLFGLKREGYLFLGSSENPMPILQHLQVVNKKWKLYKNQETKRTVNFDGFSLPQMADVKDMRAASGYEDTNHIMHNNLAEAVNTAFFTEAGYLVVCVDENGQVVKTYGDTTKYLLQKNFNLNLAELLPRPLVVAFNTLSIEAKKTGKKAAIAAIKVLLGETTINVTLAVRPLIIKTPPQRLLMVTFSEDKPGSATDTGIAYDEKKYFDQYTLILEDELNELKDKLNNTYEQLDASNDNMQSYNEELLSANEEMQSTNEEMQSVNEELHTINADYQLKNKELQEVNDDLDNYFKSNINGQLFVNNNLMLMKFSPGTVKQINLQPGDIGRPLSDISTNIKFETIADDIKQVIKDGTIISKEIETNNGKWYQVMTMPYTQQADKKNTGAIITFNDITALKKTQLELDEKNESLSRINADLENFVNTASHDLLGPLSNIEMSINIMNSVKVVDPELNQFLSVINTSVKKFRSLIGDIANIAKIESDMIVPEMVDLHEILNNIEWSLDNKIKEAKAVINRQLDVKQILFSKKNLRSIVYNLISNSIKFRSDQPPVISLRTEKRGNNVLLSVQDNGIGIDAAHLDKIFNLYGRIHQEVEGQGIGLYLAKKIVDAAKGNIVVESQPGKGSKFIIYLPG